MSTYLQIVEGPTPGRRYPLTGDTAVLGRHPECDVVLDSAAVSRQHARILREGTAFYIEDMGSRNGTFVNGARTKGRHALADGDELRVCDLTLRFLPEPPPAAPKISTLTLDDPTAGRALMIDDDRPTSTITSKIDVSTGQSGVQLSVRPEAKLKAFLEITASLSKAIKLEDVLPKVLESLFKIFVQADRAFIVMQTPDGKLIPKAVRHRRPESDETVRISRTIVRQVMESKEAILSADAASDERFDMSQSIVDFRIHSMMCAPLVDNEGTALGVLQIDTNDHRARFQDDDLQVLVGVAGQAAFAIDNAQLHAQALQQEQVQRDLELARKVQQSMLPKQPPVIEGYHFFDYYQSAREVGGDYYDYVRLPDGRVAVVVADVSGKGIAASLLMAKLSSDVRYSLVSTKTPAEAITRLNAEMDQAGWEDRFVTLAMAVLDPRTNRATLVNAGHMAPYLRHRNQPAAPVGEEIVGLPLGVVADYQYEQLEIELAPGDFLTIFTDGISEAMNAEGKLYGLERIRAQASLKRETVAELGKKLLDDVRQFAGDVPQSDDICLACFGRAQKKRGASGDTTAEQ